QRRLGRPLESAELAGMDPEVLVALFSQRPALHRFPGAMAQRVQEMCRCLVEDYGGRAEEVWTSASSGQELFTRVRALPGFGEHKAKIFVALLAKQLHVRPPGWRKASAPFGEEGTFQSVADIVDGDTLDKVRAFKQERKAAAKTATASR
ncbi:MAG: HhH-GPD-type base excision DNA repair protein, partial [Acidimicrobiales bacterium]